MNFNDLFRKVAMGRGFYALLMTMKDLEIAAFLLSETKAGLDLDNWSSDSPPGGRPAKCRYDLRITAVSAPRIPGRSYWRRPERK